jgi:hypothetical protein
MIIMAKEVVLSVLYYGAVAEPGIEMRGVEHIT